MIKVSVIEDEPEIRKLLCKIIEKQDVEIADREQSHIDLYCKMRTYRDEVKRLKKMVGED